MTRRSLFTLFAAAPAVAPAAATIATIPEPDDPKLHEQAHRTFSQRYTDSLLEKVIRGELMTDRERQWVNARIQQLEAELKPFYGVRDANWNLYDRLDGRAFHPRWQHCNCMLCRDWRAARGRSDWVDTLKV